ncbi:alpha-1,6-mannosyltransferase [Seminavis robusta]|uniref:Alpha-1,6-mannosyltransferase n=1 Tax=Seminavis robusta TaxID=568900 RepID=A0A9N8DMZ0_9STRA|nr:alpha-1,6-mannosyltransferase [Seminavis robusta]|eukprot:Sro250_g098900.1 alpha-1,6-mannosyltransferase (716) ;mRNA; r:10261-12408
MVVVRMKKALGVSLCLLVAFSCAGGGTLASTDSIEGERKTGTSDNRNNDAHQDARRLLQDPPQVEGQGQIFVFSSQNNGENEVSAVTRARTRKQKAVLEEEVFSGSVHYISNATDEQHQFLVHHGCVNGGSASRYEFLMQSKAEHLAVELWKWCALYQHGGIVLDSDTTILNGHALKRLILSEDNNAGIVVVNSQSANIVMLRHAQLPVAAKMAQLLVETGLDHLISNPNIVPQALYNFTAVEPKNWHILHQSCSCTDDHRSGLCCVAYAGDSAKEIVAVLGAHAKHMTTTKTDLPLLETEKTFQAKVTPMDGTRPSFSVSTFSAASNKKTFYQILEEANCMPSNACHKCLADKKHGATCETCREECPCFCKELCRHQKETRHNADNNNAFIVNPPLQRKDPSRLIPRIVHQTWFEDITNTNVQKYPHLSRFVNSYQTSGWEYKFYTDDVAGEFLSAHFPPQVRQAYDLLIPGAFKADLFRYCVLLIEGGVYADVDTLMGPSLDDAIPSHVGFLVGLDEPGKRIGTRMCLWNGFLASAPGHPFLAAVIETVVNNIHQRFTSLDVAQMHCPSPELSTITSYSPLFVAGPCILGSTINHVLGRYRQTPFESGELVGVQPPVDPTNTVKKQNVTIPGRTLLLSQNKMDMGAHRFTLEELNLIVLSTDFPDSDDREKLDDYEHYSETRIKFTTYGVDGVYKNNQRNMSALIKLTVGPAK